MRQPYQCLVVMFVLLIGYFLSRGMTTAKQIMCRWRLEPSSLGFFLDHSVGQFDTKFDASFAIFGFPRLGLLRCPPRYQTAFGIGNIRQGKGCATTAGVGPRSLFAIVVVIIVVRVTTELSIHFIVQGNAIQIDGCTAGKGISTSAAADVCTTGVILLLLSLLLLLYAFGHPLLFAHSSLDPGLTGTQTVTTGRRRIVVNNVNRSKQGSNSSSVFLLSLISSSSLARCFFLLDQLLFGERFLLLVFGGNLGRGHGNFGCLVFIFPFIAAAADCGAVVILILEASLFAGLCHASMCFGLFVRSLSSFLCVFLRRLCSFFFRVAYVLACFRDPKDRYPSQ